MEGLLKALEITDSLISHIDGRNKTYRDVNDAYSKVLGYERNELIGTNPFELLHEEDKSGLENLLSQLMELEDEKVIKRNLEYRIYDKDSNVRHFRANVALDKGSLYVVSNEITEVKDKEASLNMEKHRAQKIISQMEEGVYETDLQGNIIYANDGFAKLIGKNIDELQGMNYKNFCDRAYVKEIYNLFNEVFKTGKGKEGYGWKLKKKDGNTIEVNSSVYPSYDEKGEIKGFFGIAKDLTESNKKQRIDASMKVITHIVQEINQDLQIAYGYAGLLLEGKDEKEEEKEYSALETIKNSLSSLNLKKNSLQVLVSSKTEEHFKKKIMEKYMGEDVNSRTGSHTY